MRLEVGKAYHYVIDDGLREKGYTFCLSEDDREYTVQTFVLWEGQPYKKDIGEGVPYTLGKTTAFENKGTVIKEVPLYEWSLCVMHGEYHETETGESISL